MLRYPVRSSSVEYIHVQCSTVFISFIWKRGMQFGADQCSEVQWLSCMVLSSSIQSSAVWWSQAQTKTVQSSEVRCRPVQSSEVLSGSVQSSPLHSTDVRSSTFSGFCASSVPSSLISIHSLPAKYIWSSIAQVHISQLQSKLVQCSAEKCNP